MKIKECIDKVDELKPNQYTEEMKVEWLSQIDSRIYTDIILTHELPKDVELKPFSVYTTDNMAKALIAPFPYDELYVAYIQMKIDEADRETARYNNSLALFNSYFNDFEKAYGKTHRAVQRDRWNIWR